MKNNMENRASVQLNNSFGFLIEQFGFRIIKQDFSAESFGNSILILATKDVKIKFITDRGDLGVIISGYHGIEDWFELSVVRAFVTGSDLLWEYKVDDVINFFRENVFMIKKMFKPDKLLETLNQLRELSKLRGHNIVGQLGIDK